MTIVELLSACSYRHGAEVAEEDGAWCWRIRRGVAVASANGFDSKEDALRNLDKVKVTEDGVSTLLSMD